MSEFEALREQLRKAREDLAAERSALYGARQSRLRLAAQLARAARVSTPNGAAVVAGLRKQLEHAAAEEARRRHAARALTTAVADRERAFAAIANPREQMAHLSGETPILLLPVRLETRFQSVTSAEGPGEELWVRIYPDDCAVDSFEPMLSEQEVESGRRFWIAAWAAAGIDGERRAAWRDLVAAHGAGRASWIIKEYAPAGSEPVKSAAGDVRLVIAATALPPSAQQTALAAYWKAVWRAGGSRAATDQAGSALAQALNISAADTAALIARFTPANLAAQPVPPTSRSDAPVEVAWLALPPAPDMKSGSWTTPAQVHVLPDRFVVLGYQDDQLVFEAEGAPIPAPLSAGPDPSAAPDDQLRHDLDGALVVPEEMRWMTDFDRAVEVGMGIRIPLDLARVDRSRPISRVIALGLKLSEDAEGGRMRLEQLLTGHRYGNAGLALVPQGTATNNTEGDAAGYRRGEDADAAYEARFSPQPPLVPAGEWHTRQDGQLLADALGVDPALFEDVLHAGARDFAEARAMNRVLWPATLGYAMETTLHPVFSGSAIDATRWFYTHFVAGRGSLPCVRIGEQPYGILPASAISQWNPGNDAVLTIGGLPAPDGFGPYLQRLLGVLTSMRGDWANLARRVRSVDTPGDAHQILLDIIGLHPASVEFHQRYAEGLGYLFNRMKYDGLAGQLIEAVNTRGFQDQAMQLLRRLGYEAAEAPDGLRRFFFTRSQRLSGPIIDDRPLSERDPVRPYASEDRNYLEWAADAARHSLEDVRLERGFIGDRAPDALLYVVLRHALLLGYWDSAVRLHAESGVIDAAAAFAARREPDGIHVAPQGAVSESRYAYLYSRDPRVSGNAANTVGERITQSIGQDRPTSQLADQLSALDLIKKIPTARLERCFAEHIDTASFRLDSWLLGLVHLKLASMRYAEHVDPEAAGGEVVTRRGVYLGAYGWLENLQRRTPLETVPVSGELAPVFAARDEGPLLHDPTNGGFVLAPSVGQAATAAILRAGYLANASPQAPDGLAVDLSSARVRLALGLIDGIRNGQPLGALLGYRFQRGLHEDHAPLELDIFIHAMRPHFPLVANNIASTRDASAAIETIEADNVIDGLKIIDHVRQPGKRPYPFGLALPDASPAERAAIDAEVDRLLDAHDALADLALAEGVHQSVLGNYDRAGAALDAYAKGTFPPEPEFVRTPRAGVTLTQRVGVHFDASAVSPVSVARSPRAHALAPINRWLAGVLPDPARVGCRVEWLDPATDTEQDATVTQQDLRLQPIDLLYVATLDAAAAMGELEDRIIRHVVNTRKPRGDVALTVQHTVRLPPPLVTFFELAPLLRHLRAVLLNARPLTPTDVALPGEAERARDDAQSIKRDRVTLPADDLTALAGELAGFDAETLTIDEAIDQTIELFERAARFGFQQVGWGFVYAWRQRAFAGLITDVQEVVGRWRERLNDFDTAMAAYQLAAPGMTVEQRFDALGRLDLLVAALPVSPRPATPDDYETALDGQGNPQARRRLFADKLAALDAALVNSTSTLATLLNAIQGQLPVSTFDLTPLSVDAAAEGFVLFKRELQARIVTLKDEIDQRLALAADALVAHDQASSSAVRVASLQSAGNALLGADVTLMPEFTLAPAHAAEFASAYAQGDGGELTEYLRTTAQVILPVEDWLHGIARVRDKLYSWEQAALFAQILGGAAPELTPLQLPFRAGQGWLALQFDPEQTLDGERLLYTAHFAVPPGTGAACGLLIDEWTEVLPARDETVGLSFNYDRPSSEPPQAWLLATPATETGPWRWADLIGAVTETFALARLRAVELTHIDATPYAAFLPATDSASGLRGISITANLARVNNLNAFVQGGGDA